MRWLTPCCSERPSSRGGFAAGRSTWSCAWHAAGNWSISDGQPASACSPSSAGSSCGGATASSATSTRCGRGIGRSGASLCARSRAAFADRRARSAPRRPLCRRAAGSRPERNAWSRGAERCVCDGDPRRSGNTARPRRRSRASRVDAVQLPAALDFGPRIGLAFARRGQLTEAATHLATARERGFEADASRPTWLGWLPAGGGVERDLRRARRPRRRRGARRSPRSACRPSHRCRRRRRRLHRPGASAPRSRARPARGGRGAGGQRWCAASSETPP